MEQERNIAMQGTLTILLVEDETANRNAVKRLLRKAGYRFLEAANGEEGLELVAAESIDLILLDLGMPVMDGYTFLEKFRQLEQGRVIPVCVMTAWSDAISRRRVIDLGADDFIAKPVDTTELETRVKSLLRISAYQKHLHSLNSELEQKVEERTEHLEHALGRVEEAWQQNRLAYKEMVVRLGLAAEFKDRCTASHLQRMSHYSVLLARRVGWGDDDAEMLLDAAKLHDIGKIGIPDTILLKKGKLTEAEFAEMKQHSRVGATILAGSDSRLLQLAEEVALTHHERFDGSGYPDGLVGKAIPESGRIVAIADVFDALMSRRPYKEAWPFAQVVETMQASSGSHFDPALLEKFLMDSGALMEIYHRFPE